MRARFLLVPVALTFLTACGATTYDSRISNSVADAQILVTALPTGATSQLLTQLVAEMTKLSSLIGPNQSGNVAGGKTNQLNLIKDLWAATETEVITTDPAAAESIGRMVDLSSLAVEKNRPADADKAAKFAGQVINDYLSKH